MISLSQEQLRDVALEVLTVAARRAGRPGARTIATKLALMVLAFETADRRPFDNFWRYLAMEPGIQTWQLTYAALGEIKKTVRKVV